MISFTSLTGYLGAQKQEKEQATLNVSFERNNLPFWFTVTFSLSVNGVSQPGKCYGSQHTVNLVTTQKTTIILLVSILVPWGSPFHFISPFKSIPESIYGKMPSRMEMIRLQDLIFVLLTSCSITQHQGRVFCNVYLHMVSTSYNCFLFAMLKFLTSLWSWHSTL